MPRKLKMWKVLALSVAIACLWASVSVRAEVTQTRISHEPTGNIIAND